VDSGAADPDFDTQPLTPPAAVNGDADELCHCVWRLRQQNAPRSFGPVVFQKLALRYRAARRAVYPNVGHSAQSAAMTVTSMGVCLRRQGCEGIWVGHDVGSGMATVSKTGFYRSSQLPPLEQLPCMFYLLPCLTRRVS
jgi:hypothetical protein